MIRLEQVSFSELNSQVKNREISWARATDAVKSKLDGEICFLSGTWQCKLHSEHYYITLINVVHINKIYILTLYSGYFGKNPGILGSMIIKICANIKWNKVVYIKLQNKSVYQYFFT